MERKARENNGKVLACKISENEELATQTRILRYSYFLFHSYFYHQFFYSNQVTLYAFFLEYLKLIYNILIALHNVLVLSSKEI